MLFIVVESEDHQSGVEHASRLLQMIMENGCLDASFLLPSEYFRSSYETSVHALNLPLLDQLDFNEYESRLMNQVGIGVSCIICVHYYRYKDKGIVFHSRRCNLPDYIFYITDKDSTASEFVGFCADNGLCVNGIINGDEGTTFPSLLMFSTISKALFSRGQRKVSRGRYS